MLDDFTQDLCSSILMIWISVARSTSVIALEHSARGFVRAAQTFANDLRVDDLDRWAIFPDRSLQLLCPCFSDKKDSLLACVRALIDQRRQRFNVPGSGLSRHLC